MTNDPSGTAQVAETWATTEQRKLDLRTKMSRLKIQIEQLKKTYEAADAAYNLISTMLDEIEKSEKIQ